MVILESRSKDLKSGVPGSGAPELSSGAGSSSGHHTCQGGKDAAIPFTVPTYFLFL